MKPIAPNTLIQNRYLVVQLIGKGGMGEVYLAVDQRLGSAVALKRTFFSDDELLGNAFEREARTLARLRHPALPKVSDHFTEEATQYLVMEHISGEDISKRLELTEKPYPLSWVLFWADHLLDALTYLHTHDPPIIHRDIKPQNLKLTDENNIVLLDFGLAKNTAGDTRVTTSGSIVGYTPHYAPMEQIRGTGTDARSDVYSLSATLYQILTNVVPSDALTRADAFLSGFEDPVKPISEINAEVSESISGIISKGMEVSQDKRFKSAREMQKALRDAYSKVKSDVTTKTASLNQNTPLKAKPSQIVTEVIPTPPSVSVIQSHISQEDNSIPNRQDFNSQPPSKDEASEPNFDATLRMDVDVHDSVPQQSAIETEVFIAGSSPEITAAQNGEFDKKDNFTPTDDFNENKFSTPVEDFSQTDDFGANEQFSKSDDYSDVGKFSPDSTVPLFSLDKQDDEEVSSEIESDFDVISPAAESAASGFAAQQNNSPAVDYKTPTPVQKSVPPQKSNGKIYAVAGGLAAFFILAIGAAGLVWYMFSDSSTITKENPTPTPQATVEVTPTPQPTLEAVTNTNSEETTNTNTNSSVEEELANTNTTDKIDEQSGKTKREQITQPPPVKVSTPKPNKQVTAAKTPTDKKPVTKKTPVRGSSSDILP
ncbi:hypothetical protein BH20ACI1_BH20ACI1_06420 [soil metagenome]